MRNVLVVKTVVASGLLAAAVLAQGCTADTLEVEGPSDVPRQTGKYIPPETPGYPTGGDTCSFSLDLVREAALDEVTTLGFSGDDVLALFNADAHGTLRWADGGDGATEVWLHATSSAETIRFNDFPKDQGFCTPTMNVPLDELSVRTTDGKIDARVVPSTEPYSRFELVASSDGNGGIGLIFDGALTLAPEQVASPLIDDAIAAHPDHDSRLVTIELSLSSSGRKARCIRDEEISPSPASDCNVFDGVLRYHSSNTAALNDVHSVPADAFYSEALAAWLWSE
jgi:hypothetical protein